jgi:hypothetical protein
VQQILYATKTSSTPVGVFITFTPSLALPFCRGRAGFTSSRGVWHCFCTPFFREHLSFLCVFKIYHTKNVASE